MNTPPRLSPQAQRQVLRLRLAARRERLRQLLGADSADVFPRSLTLRLLRSLPAGRMSLSSVLVMLLGPRALRGFSLLLIVGRLLRLLASDAPRQMPAPPRPRRLK